jgi:hypothetical protein
MEGLRAIMCLYSHNDLPYNLRAHVKNQLANFNFSADLSSDPYWSKLDTSFTDLPRLRAGRVGAQVCRSTTVFVCIRCSQRAIKGNARSNDLFRGRKESIAWGYVLVCNELLAV